VYQFICNYNIQSERAFFLLFLNQSVVDSASKLGKLSRVLAREPSGRGCLCHFFQVGCALTRRCVPILWHTFNSKAFVLAPSSWSLWNPNSELQVEDRQHTGGSVLLGGVERGAVIFVYLKLHVEQYVLSKKKEGVGETVHIADRLTCQFRPSSLFLALLASESPLRYQSLFPTPFSPRHYQQRRDSGRQQMRRRWATLRTISWERNGKIDGTE